MYVFYLEIPARCRAGEPEKKMAFSKMSLQKVLIVKYLEIKIADKVKILVGCGIFYPTFLAFSDPSNGAFLLKESGRSRSRMKTNIGHVGTGHV